MVTCETVLQEMLKEILQKERKYVRHSDLHLGADENKRREWLLCLIRLYETERAQNPRLLHQEGQVQCATKALVSGCTSQGTSFCLASTGPQIEPLSFDAGD